MDLTPGRLAADQNDVLHRAQLRAIGLDRFAIRTQVRAGRWQLYGPTVVVLHGGPLTKSQRQWAASLAAGPYAALAGLTALELAGLRGWQTEAVHILSPRGRSPTCAPGQLVVAHETRCPRAGSLAKSGRPGRTGVARSAIDAAGWSDRARTACGLLAAVVQQRLTTADRLLLALEEAGMVKFRGVMRSALLDIAGGAEALTEIDFVRFCRRYAIGTVRQQTVRYDGEGRKRYLDVEIESPGGRRISCEIDGAVHLVPRTYWNDMSRANELLISGHTQLRFPSLAYRLEPARVADQLLRALAVA